MFDMQRIPDFYFKCYIYLKYSYLKLGFKLWDYLSLIEIRELWWPCVHGCLESRGKNTNYYARGKNTNLISL